MSQAALEIPFYLRIWYVQQKHNIRSLFHDSSSFCLHALRFQLNQLQNRTHHSHFILAFVIHLLTEPPKQLIESSARVQSSSRSLPNSATDQQEDDDDGSVLIPGARRSSPFTRGRQQQQQLAPSSAFSDDDSEALQSNAELQIGDEVSAEQRDITSTSAYRSESKPDLHLLLLFRTIMAYYTCKLIVTLHKLCHGYMQMY